MANRSTFGASARCILPAEARTEVAAQMDNGNRKARRTALAMWRRHCRACRRYGRV